MQEESKGLEPAYVEFVFRVHADGRRERTAVVYARHPGGAVRPVSGRIDGNVGQFAAEAVAEAVELGKPRDARRVQIDERQFHSEWGRRRRR